MIFSFFLLSGSKITSVPATIVACVVTIIAAGSFASNISLDHVDNLVGGTHLPTGQEITFHLRVNNNSGNKVDGFINGFRVYATQGADWTTTVGDTTGTLGQDEFDLGYFITSHSVTGSGADTIGFSGVANPLTGAGMPNEFNEIAFTITIGPIDPNTTDGQICLDSSFIRRPGTGSGLWVWPKLYFRVGTAHTVIPWRHPGHLSLKIRSDLSSSKMSKLAR